jgi:hypothetical protein
MGIAGRQAPMFPGGLSQNRHRCDKAGDIALTYFGPTTTAKLTAYNVPNPPAKLDRSE